MKKLFGKFFVVDVDDDLEIGGKIREQNVGCSAVIGLVLLIIFGLIFLLGRC